MAVALALIFHGPRPDGCTSARTARPPGPLRLEKVKGDLYMISGEGGNVAVNVTDEGVILVDDMFDRNHADILAQVKSMTGQPLRYVLQHASARRSCRRRCKMLPIAEVIAHRNVRANLVANKQPYYEDTPGTPIGLPRVTFSDEAPSTWVARRCARSTSAAVTRTATRSFTFRTSRSFTPAICSSARVLRRRGARRRHEASGREHLRRLRAGRQLSRVEQTLDGAADARLRHRHPRTRPGVDAGDVVKFKADLETMRSASRGAGQAGRRRKDDIVKTLEKDYGWRATGCPPSPPTPGCLQFQQSTR